MTDKPDPPTTTRRKDRILKEQARLEKRKARRARKQADHKLTRDKQ